MDTFNPHQSNSIVYSQTTFKTPYQNLILHGEFGTDMFKLTNRNSQFGFVNKTSTLK